jgi:hypothetical protein
MLESDNEYVMLEFRWSSKTGHHGMPYPEELEYLGYEKVTAHPRYQDSILMVRSVRSLEDGPAGSRGASSSVPKRSTDDQQVGREDMERT